MHQYHLILFIDFLLSFLMILSHLLIIHSISYIVLIYSHNHLVLYHFNLIILILIMIFTFYISQSFYINFEL
jgi:hypothetical protein